MGKIKAVLDTNVLISMLFKRTLAKELSKAIDEKNIELYSSEEILKELARILTYPKIENILKKVGIDKRVALESLIEKLKIVVPKVKVNVIKKDPSDNKILECTLKVKASYIVSGDEHLLELKEFKNVKILTPREFLEKLV